MIKKTFTFVIYKVFVKYLTYSKMDRSETIEEYYAKHPFLKSFDGAKGNSHFNIIPIAKQHQMENGDSVTFGRRDFFKICIISGKSKIHYADKSFEILEHGLLFTNPQIPYEWEVIGGLQEGFTCIFTESFFEGFGDIKKYPVFQLGGYPVYELTQEEHKSLTQIFLQMQEESNSTFEFKNDVLKNLVFQLIHLALKIRPSTNLSLEKNNAAKRITALFISLLENQFPIRSSLEGLSLRKASDYSSQMSIHVNHLNKSVKEITSETTSEIISKRILKEAKILLKHSSWTISEISYSLGFEGPAHFSSFFKKQTQISPSQFKNLEL
ncbi:AraC family transcriptional regulator [Chryseobacterium nematophagum]|uniref:AraC family transcriptional regulator n=1 Tax=Chryseobacterium nematophagum TaxID=2305228 RepID=A0A3M7TFR1_9FLAO|nr:AraC family transcriptional regulator [Chryseobacterium nematophagum]RNA62422.1 AraC family transcriptional regulator [Chryseobacterium nematophagum]